jgi:hypothetical protein
MSVLTLVTAFAVPAPVHDAGAPVGVVPPSVQFVMTRDGRPRGFRMVRVVMPVGSVTATLAPVLSQVVVVVTSSDGSVGQAVAASIHGLAATPVWGHDQDRCG